MFATWSEADQRWAFGIKGEGYVEISGATYRQLFQAQQEGHALGRDADNLPMVIRQDETQSIADLYQSKAATINRACEALITGGFGSDALGARHQYSSQLDDQLNLTGAILRGLDMPYACRNEQGVKDFRLHTSAQLRQVGDDFTLYKLQLLQHANELKQQLDLALAASDAEAMTLVRWEAVQP